MKGKARLDADQFAGFATSIDSLAPAHSPATLAGLTVYLAVPNRLVLLRHAAFRRAVLE